MRSLRSLFRRLLVTRSMLVRAHILRLLRRHRAAVRLLQRLITLSPACFGAHLLLGRIALLRGARTDALQEFGICFRLDAARFQRQMLPGSLKALVVARFRCAREIACFEIPLGDARELPGEWDDLIAEECTPAVEPAPPGTDFVDAAEYHRFRDRPPIQFEDVRDVDLDLLMSRLMGHPHPGSAREEGR